MALLDSDGRGVSVGYAKNRSATRTGALYDLGYNLLGTKERRCLETDFCQRREWNIQYLEGKVDARALPGIDDICEGFRGVLVSNRPDGVKAGEALSLLLLAT